ncbi:MAG: hypothetical protein ACYTG0_08040 [Planctomycetota bacterium]
MEAWSSVLIGLVLCFAAGWLVDSHLRAWRNVRQRRDELDPHEWEYRLSQFNRRMQTSAILGLLGLGILVGQLIGALGVPPLVRFLYWGAIMLLTVWLGVLAFVDFSATRRYFGRLREDFHDQKTRLQEELRRLRRLRGNGRREGEVSREDQETEDPDAGKKDL